MRARATIAILLVCATTVVGPTFASGCGVRGSRSDLARADAAFIGTVVGNRTYDDGSIWTFEIERDFKRNLGPRIEVFSERIRHPFGVSSGGSGTFSARIGDRIGALISAWKGYWHIGPCSPVAPEQLSAVAAPLPEPTGSGPLGFLIGVSLGEVTMVALDRRGATLGYVADGGDRVVLCPGSRRAVEWSADDPHALLVRDLRTLEPVARLRATPSLAEMENLACLDPRGRSVVVSTIGQGAEPVMRSLLMVRRNGSRELFGRRAERIVLGGERAYVVDPHGTIGTIDYGTGRLRTIADPKTRVHALAESPDGTRLVGLVADDGEEFSKPVKLFVASLHHPDRPWKLETVMSAAVTDLSRTVLWPSPRSIALYAFGRVRFFDLRLREIAKRRWDAGAPVHSDGRMFAVSSEDQGSRTFRSALVSAEIGERPKPFANLHPELDVGALLVVPVGDEVRVRQRKVPRGLVPLGTVRRALTITTPPVTRRPLGRAFLGVVATFGMGLALVGVVWIGGRARKRSAMPPKVS